MSLIEDMDKSEKLVDYLAQEVQRVLEELDQSWVGDYESEKLKDIRRLIKEFRKAHLTQGMLPPFEKR